MASFNKVFLIGNLTRDPELRMTPKGSAVTAFGLALNRKFKDESGNEREEVTFVDLTAFGKTAELVAKYLKRGSACHIEGRLKLDQWEDKTTKEKRSKLAVVVEQVQFLGGTKQSSGQADEPAREATPPRTSRPANPDIEEDVPF